MSGDRAIGRIIDRLCADNPDLEVIHPGGRTGGHYKLFLHGRLVGILPQRLAKEGLSRNFKAQYRRGGLKVDW